jgi:hypothetical protein
MTVYDLFEKARSRSAVPGEVLKEARKRRDAIRWIVDQAPWRTVHTTILSTTSTPV